MKDEFEYIKSWCLLIVKYLAEKSPNALMDEFKNSITNLTDTKKSLKQLKILKRDLTEWARGLSKDDFQELNNLLYDTFKDNLEDSSNISITEVNDILQRGKIKNDDEFRLLIARIDEIYANESNRAELEIINKLLAEYEKR